MIIVVIIITKIVLIYNNSNMDNPNSIYSTNGNQIIIFSEILSDRSKGVFTIRYNFISIFIMITYNNY